MYINLAVSLAVDLGLYDEVPSSLSFNSVRQEGLVVDGSFTQVSRVVSEKSLLYYIEGARFDYWWLGVACNTAKLPT